MTVDELIKHIAASPQHQHLYHFTDETNFDGISKHGILSKEQLRARGLWPPAATGGNDLSQSLDLARGIDPCVSLCMTRNHGMKFLAQQAGRLPNPHYLGISPAILATPGVRVALGVANANGVVILPIAEAIAHMDVEVIYSRTDWNDAAIQTRLRAAEKFEVLIPTSVPTAMIIGRY